MYSDVKWYWFFLYAVDLSFEKAKEIKSQHPNLLLITEFVPVNITGQELCHIHVIVSCVCNLEKTPLRGGWLYPQSWLKRENDLFSGSGGKAVGFEFSKGFELLHMNRCAIRAKNLLCKNQKNHLWQVTLSSKHWRCSMKRKLKYFQVAGPLCTVLQSVSTE